MGSDLAATEPCAVCSALTKQQTGRVCPRCYARMAACLVYLPELADNASHQVGLQTSGRGVSRVAPTSKPPLNLDAIDPALALIELTQGDRSSRVTILEALESWERVVRSERGLVPYGVASSRNRDPLSSTAVLHNVCRFLGVWLEWMAGAAQVDICDFSAHLSSARRVLQRWAPDSGQAPRWRVSCPSDVEGERECGASLSFIGLDDVAVFCRRCGSSWSPARLLAVASVAGGESVWVDAEAAAVAVGVDPSTVRRWARTGKVRRRGLRYSLADIQAAVRSGVSGID